MATSVPRLFPRGTFALLGCGPSLCAEDVGYVRGKARVIAINDAVQLAQWADVLYACDATWWRKHAGVPSFSGLKYGLEAGAAKGVTVLRNTGKDGLQLDPAGLKHGKNSGYQAINLAVHLGAARILLLGYDMRSVGGRDHFNDRRDPNLGKYAGWIENFKTLIEPLKKIGVEVVNCTPGSALSAFPLLPLREALPDVEPVAAEPAELVEAPL